MIRALVIKELRENVGVLAVAAFVYAWVLYAAMDGRFEAVGAMPAPNFVMFGNVNRGIPFVSSSFSSTFMAITALVAVALGLRQSVVENIQGTYLFLLHRPFWRRDLFLVKLAVGISMLLGCAAIPLLIYARWLSVPGHVAAPFTWSMTTGTCDALLTLPVVYLGAFLSGIRPARWFGTRLFPLVGGAMAAALSFFPIWPWGAAWLFLAGAYALFVVGILHAVRVRDYA